MDFDDFFEYLDGSVFTPLMLIGAFIALAIRHWTGRWSQRVQSQIGEIPSKCGLNGRDVATRLLGACGLGDVPVRGEASKNHYHPWKREIRLRPDTYDTVSLAAVASAAHEVGHAQQFAERTWLCRLRFVFWPVCWALIALTPIYAILCLVGVLPHLETYIGTAVLATCAVVVVLQLPISLPLESDATRRARELATTDGLLAKHEQDGFDRLLGASWKTHASAELQRWIVLTSIALATAGYLWYESYSNRLLDQMPAYDTIAMEDKLLDQAPSYDESLDELPPQMHPVTAPLESNVYVYQVQGWEHLLWLIPVSPFLLVIGVIIMTFLGKSKRPARRKVSAGV